MGEVKEAHERQRTSTCAPLAVSWYGLGAAAVERAKEARWE
jgi:hypothetical protein